MTVKRANVLIEATAQASAVHLLCVCTYILEGDNPLIFVAWNELKKIDDALAAGIPLTRIEKVIGRYIELKKNSMDQVNAKVMNAFNAVGEAAKNKSKPKRIH